jgi:hypothetical protein
VTVQSAQDPAPAGTRATEQDSSWTALGRGILEEVAAVARERLRLLALEGQQFALAAGQMLTLGVIAAVFVLTAWFVLVGGILAGAVQLGVPWAAAIAGGVVGNLLAAFLVWLAMRRLLALMMFSATLRHLQLARTTPQAARSEPEASSPIPATSATAIDDPAAERSLRASP